MNAIFTFIDEIIKNTGNIKIFLEALGISLKLVLGSNEFVNEYISDLYVHADGIIFTCFEVRISKEHPNDFILIATIDANSKCIAMDDILTNYQVKFGGLIGPIDDLEKYYTLVHTSPCEVYFSFATSGQRCLTTITIDTF